MDEWLIRLLLIVASYIAGFVSAWAFLLFLLTCEKREYLKLKKGTPDG